jgi:hypothetical protein
MSGLENLAARLKVARNASLTLYRHRYSRQSLLQDGDQMKRRWRIIGVVALTQPL